MSLIQIHPDDTVAVATAPIAACEEAELRLARGGSASIRVLEAIGQGHKVAITDLSAGQDVVKYGQVIGHMTCDVPTGGWVHTHSMTTNLDAELAYTYEPQAPAAVHGLSDVIAAHSLSEVAAVRGLSEGAAVRGLSEVARGTQPDTLTFMGYRRSDGSVGIRNEIWIIPTVACVNGIAREVREALEAELTPELRATFDAIVHFEHPFGCSQVGEDLDQTGRTLAGLAVHPNAGAVLVLGLGCEELGLAQFKEYVGSRDASRIAYVNCQDEPDEVAAALCALKPLVEVAARAYRQKIPIDELVVGLECGGSDGFSGITANPVIGRVTDIVTALGGTSVLSEVPEMFGGERLLLNRCDSRATFDAAVDMINWYKRYFIARNTPIYENPSPGNVAGGITTLEDKSCGCVQKGGSATVTQVVARYGDPVTKRGLVLYNTPGNDPSSVTGLAAAGCHLALFSTGRGTPFEAPIPTIKVSSNTELFENKRSWIDFDAGVVVSGDKSVAESGNDLFDLVVKVANGQFTKSEARGLQGIAIWKGGVTL